MRELGMNSNKQSNIAKKGNLNENHKFFEKK